LCVHRPFWTLRFRKRFSGYYELSRKQLAKSQCIYDKGLCLYLRVNRSNKRTLPRVLIVVEAFDWSKIVLRSKLFSIATLGCLFTGIASAQVLTPAETEINQAFANLRGVDKVYVHLYGNEYVGATTTPIATDLFWDRPLASTAQDMKMEMIESRNGIQLRRIVADGQHVWGIDLLKNTYSASRYGSYTATKPTDYEVNGLQSLNLLASSQSAFLARMTREVWGGIASAYRPWIPASAVRNEQSVVGTGSTFNDPVVPTRTYTGTPTTKYFVYWVTKSSVPVRSLTFELEYNSTTTNWDLASLYYSDYSKVGASTRLVDWQADVYTGVLPATGNFVYSPLPGARAIAGPRPNGTG